MYFDPRTTPQTLRSSECTNSEYYHINNAVLISSIIQLLLNLSPVGRVVCSFIIFSALVSSSWDRCVESLTLLSSISSLACGVRIFQSNEKHLLLYHINVNPSNPKQESTNSTTQVADSRKLGREPARSSCYDVLD